MFLMFTLMNSEVKTCLQLGENSKLELQVRATFHTEFIDTSFKETLRGRTIGDLSDDFHVLG